MMRNSGRDRQLFKAGRGALALWLLLSAAGCDTTTAMDGGAPFVLATGGAPVRANSPPGIEVSLGNKLVLQAGEPTTLD
jgi:hypothetical protein